MRLFLEEPLQLISCPSLRLCETDPITESLSRYLAASRKFTEETLDDFGVGNWMQCKCNANAFQEWRMMKTSRHWGWGILHLFSCKCFPQTTINKGTPPWGGRGFLIIAVWEFESGMSIIYCNLHINYVSLTSVFFKASIGQYLKNFAAVKAFFFSSALCLQRASATYM
jgi:hypothetical protein